MLTLHHSPTTRSIRIKWLLEELSLPYHQNTYNFFNRERFDPKYLSINTIGSFPSLEDDDLILTESGAIINYILRNHSDGRFSVKPGSSEEPLIDEWMYWSEGLFTVHQRIFTDHCARPPGCVIDPIPSVGEEAKREALRYAGVLEARLEANCFIVGSKLTGADFMLSFPLYIANMYGWLADMPMVKAYFDRFSTRPAFKRAIADTEDFLTKMRSSVPEFPSYRSPEYLIEK